MSVFDDKYGEYVLYLSIGEAIPPVVDRIVFGKYRHMWAYFDSVGMTKLKILITEMVLINIDTDQWEQALPNILNVIDYNVLINKVVPFPLSEFKCLGQIGLHLIDIVYDLNN